MTHKRMKVSSVLALLLGALAIAEAGDSGCLCTYGEPCWPSVSTFSQLQSRVSQPLIYPLPTASACYPPSDPSGNCTAVTENWLDGNWRSSIPGSMESPYYETFTFQNGTIDACYLNTTFTGTCQQGSVPVIGVDARSVEDIQAAVTFAVQQNLKLVVKNTGHDFVGRSSARGSFMVWTHNMKDITYNPTFIPQGAQASETYDALTIGAGVQWHEAYTAVDGHGRMIVGGNAVGGSVGAAGGWLAGGGHSSLSPSYGLGVDNAIEISVVLSTGEFLVTNNHQNSDLFWALRGGGGGTFGIVTSVTYRIHLSVPTHIYTYQVNVTNTTVLRELVGSLFRYQIQFTEDGWGGYGSFQPQGMQFNLVGPNMTNETAVANLQAWRNYTASLEPLGVVVVEDDIRYFPSWYDSYLFLFGAGATENGISGAYATRLLSQEAITANYSQLAEIFTNCSGAYNMNQGGKVHQFGADSAGINPAWRKAIVMPICALEFPDGASSTEIQGLKDKVRGWIQAIHDVSPNDGAYFNEASLLEIDWQKTFFGEHYPKLKAIKDTYDPHRLFVVADGVGSEDWNSDLTCRH